MGHVESGKPGNHLEVLAELPGDIYRKTLLDIIENNCRTPIGDCKITIDAASSKGDNYIGVVRRVNVKETDGKEMNVVIKLPPPNAARREQFFARPCFLRESEFYDVVYPIYKKFQEEKGIPVGKDMDGFYQIPVCYKTLTNDNFEGLFLEDLKVTGFEMFDRFKEVTADHVNLVMEVLGRFHAISFAIKDQKPELIESYKGLVDIFLQRNLESREQIVLFFNQLKKQAIDTLNDHKNEDLKSRSMKVMNMDFYELLESCIGGALAEPYAVIAHGDCWNNNIMFRYENGIPVEIRLLDWQIMRYASPVCDLMYYIFGCTTKSIRDKHYYEFLNVYYNSLSSFMKRLGSDASKVFPRRAFNEHLLRFGKFGLAMAIMVLPIFTSNVEDTPDMDAIAEKFKVNQETGAEVDENLMSFTSESTMGVYRERMNGVFEDMYDLGYI